MLPIAGRTEWHGKHFSRRPGIFLLLPLGGGEHRPGLYRPRRESETRTAVRCPSIVVEERRPR